MEHAPWFIPLLTRYQLPNEMPVGTIWGESVKCACRVVGGEFPVDSAELFSLFDDIGLTVLFDLESNLKQV